MAGPMLKRDARGRYRPMSDINVVPFVDVMLVLLIIFMVAAPMMTSGVPLDLPRTAAQPLNQEQQTVTVSIDAEGRVFLQEGEVPLDALVERLRAATADRPEGEPPPRILVRGDRAIAYGQVMEVMGVISAGGFSRVALLAEQMPAAAGGPPAAAPSGTPAN